MLKTEGEKQRVMVQMCALPHEHVILATYALAVCYVRVFKSVCTHFCSRACMRVYVCACVRVCLQVCMYSWMHVCR